MTEKKMVRWHHQLDGHKSEQTLGDGDGQGGLACCSPWGHKESDMTEQLDNNKIPNILSLYQKSNFKFNKFKLNKINLEQPKGTI